MQLAADARAAKLRIAGLIAPPVFNDQEKTAIDLIDQSSGECRRLAVRRGVSGSGIQTTNWLLDPAVLAWGNQRLHDLPACDLLIIDELGPLEFVQGAGLQAGLRLIDERHVSRTVVVIRPSFLTLARKRWPWAAVLDLGDERVEIKGRDG